MKTSKGFTLIELLIVIGILAVLATLTVLVLNPAQLFAQARDSQRMADFRTLQSAVNFYLVNPTSTAHISPNLAFATNGTTCGGMTNTGCATRNVYTVAGAGWVAIDLQNGTNGGSPVASLPVDPTNSATYFYSYRSGAENTLTYEMNARLESQKYRTSMTTDGGDDNTCSSFTEATCWYEAGNDPGLDL